MGKFRCHEKGCDWEIELFYHDGDGISKILAHERTHKENTKEVMKTGRNECKECEGKGYIEYTYTVDEPIDSDVSEADSGRNE
jgi:hypothetical protein